MNIENLLKSIPIKLLDSTKNLVADIWNYLLNIQLSRFNLYVLVLQLKTEEHHLNYTLNGKVLSFKDFIKVVFGDVHRIDIKDTLTRFKKVYSDNKYSELTNLASSGYVLFTNYIFIGQAYNKIQDKDIPELIEQAKKSTKLFKQWLVDKAYLEANELLPAGKLVNGIKNIEKLLEDINIDKMSKTDKADTLKSVESLIKILSDKFQIIKVKKAK